MARAKKKTTKKKARRNTGPPPFPVTQAQRDFVAAAIAAGLSAEVARELVINEKTGKPLARSTFFKSFGEEIKHGQKMITGKAIGTVVEAMGNRNDKGHVTVAAQRASEFWLARREGDLFSEKRINENIERKAADELGKVTEEQAERIADNVLQAARQNKKARARRDKPSIDDEPAGSA